jgi:hypothetical protein
MPISDRIAKAVWGLFAGRCAICREEVIEKTSAGSVSLVGEVADIIGEKATAARGSSEMDISARNDLPNLILLCRPHHKIVDDDHAEYTVERLQATRSEYLAWIDGRLTQIGAWNCKLATLFYINVPRLGELALTEGLDITPHDLYGHDSLSELGLGLVRVMHAYKNVLAALPIKSIPLVSISFIDSRSIGALTHFERINFRTKNISSTSGVWEFSGSLEKCPHIYVKISGWKFIILIDRRWITTRTAHVYFRPPSGQTEMSGFARINSINFASRTIIASGLALGLPPSVLDQMFEAEREQLHNRAAIPHAAKNSRAQNTLSFFERLEDDLTKARDSIWMGDLENCDFCAKSFVDENYMVDGPQNPRGPWGCMCESCYIRTQHPLGIGMGQLYKQNGEVWQLVGGYPESDADDEDDIPLDVAEGFADWLSSHRNGE